MSSAQSVTDGGTGDLDGAANGVIDDPGGPAKKITIGSDGGNGCFILTIKK